MKRARYSIAIEFIAYNDCPGDDDNEADIATYVTVGLVADLFGKTVDEVAKDIYFVRQGREFQENMV